MTGLPRDTRWAFYYCPFCGVINEQDVWRRNGYPMCRRHAGSTAVRVERIAVAEMLGSDEAVEAYGRGVWPNHWPRIPNITGERDAIRRGLRGLADFIGGEAPPAHPDADEAKP